MYRIRKHTHKLTRIRHPSECARVRVSLSHSRSLRAIVVRDSYSFVSALAHAVAGRVCHVRFAAAARAHIRFSIGPPVVSNVTRSIPVVVAAAAYSVVAACVRSAIRQQ